STFARFEASTSCRRCVSVSVSARPRMVGSKRMFGTIASLASRHGGELELAADAVLGEFVAERADADAEEPRRLRPVVAGPLERGQDELALDLSDRQSGEAAAQARDGGITVLEVRRRQDRP